MTTPIEIQRTDAEPRRGPKGLLWKWSLVVTACVFAFVLAFLSWQCGAALRDKSSANAAVRHFHEELDSGQYESIFQEADRDMAQAGKHDEFVRFLEVVHAKLGSVGTEKLLSVTVNTTTGGETFTVAQYETTFTHGSAIETFTWKRRSGDLKLYGYNIQSTALLEEKSAIEDTVDPKNGNLHVEIPIRAAHQKPTAPPSNH